ncbi:reverse transcriptase [Plakobranchus ocellatus]|uniref:Reverse transcriptase n=1 Tax=Plakobranchus ocellatus TaxID=259542 RepID=A0AAV3Z4T2_9GAST|nr:reverse transcriptase [Plakobranchus ocellatus]
MRVHVTDDAAHQKVLVPILKKGKCATTAESYRSISLTSVISKTLKRMVNAQLYHSLDCPHGTLHPYPNQGDPVPSSTLADGLPQGSATSCTFPDIHEQYRQRSSHTD